jgi:hypothetical protein
MALNRYAVRVDPQGQAVTVDILDMSGASVAVCNDSPRFEAGQTSLPKVITAQTDFWLPTPGPFDVSCKVGGAEVAEAGAVARRTLTDVPTLLVPDWPRERTASASGGSSALYYLDLLHNSSADNYFAWSSIALKPNGPQTVTLVSPLLTIAAAGGIAEPELIAPAFVSGDLAVQRFELSVWNAAGTQKKSWRRTDIGSLAASSDQFIDLSTGTAFDSVGSDITWDSGWGGPLSAAGGQFQFAAVLLLVTTDLA